MYDQRSQSEVVGIVLLIGLVIVGASSVFVVGNAAIGSIQEHSQYQHDINEINSISHQVESTVRSEEGSTSIAVQDGYVASNSDRPSVTITVDGDERYDEQIGQLARDGIVYEGGLVIDEEDNRVLNSPRFDLRAESTLLELHHLTGVSGGFDGSITHTGTAELLGGETPDVLEVEIESEYYQLWAEQFEGTNAPVTTTEYERNQTVRAVFDYETGPTFPDSSLSISENDGAALNLNDMPSSWMQSYDRHGNTGDNLVVSSTVTDSNLGAGSGELVVDGDFRYDESGSEPDDSSTNFEVTGDIEPMTPLELNSTAEFLIDSETVDSQPYDGTEDLSGGIYHASNDDLSIDERINVTGTSVLIVEGDLEVDADGELVVDAAIDIYVHGETTLGRDAAIRTVDAYDSEAVSMFVGGDIHVEGEQDRGGPARDQNPKGPEITGYIHGTESTIAVHGNFSAYGAIVVDEINGDEQNDHFHFHFDERLEDRLHPYATRNTLVEMPFSQTAVDVRIATVDLE